MSSEIKKTVKSSAIYMIGVVLSRVASFIMLPIYTRYLTPADYGIMELLDMSIDIITIILGLGLGRAIFRFYTKYEDVKDKNEVVSTLFILMSILNGLAFLALFGFSGTLARMLFDSLVYSLHFKIMAITLLFRASVSLPLVYIQAIYKPKLFVMVGFMKLLMTLSLNIYFVVFMEMKVLGILYGGLISSVVISLFMLPYLLKQVGISFSKEKAVSMIRFGLPLVIGGIASFYLNFSDRYFIKFWSNLTEVGLYSLGYRFGFLLLMITYTPFSNIWNVQRFDIHKKENAKEVYQKVFVMISFVIILGAFFMSIFCRDVLRIMSSPEYEAAYKVVPIILLAFVVQGWTSYIDIGIMLSEKTIHITTAVYLAAITVTVFCFLLIPIYGSIGAAYATLIAFIVRFFWIKYKSYQFYDMGLIWKKPIILLLLATFILGISYAIHQENIYASIAINTGLSGLFLGSILWLPLLPPENKLQLIRVIKNPVSGIKELKKDFSQV